MESGTRSCLDATARADVLHCPTYRGPLRSRVPLVVTVHDLAVLRHPEAFNRWTRTYSPRVVPRRPARRAPRDRGVPVHAARARRAARSAGREDPGRAQRRRRRVHAATARRRAATTSLPSGRSSLARTWSVSSRQSRRTDRELRVVGARGWGGVDISANGVRWLGEVDDAELARLYRGAACVAYPSLYEGFGIPDPGGDGVRRARGHHARHGDGGGR